MSSTVAVDAAPIPDPPRTGLGSTYWLCNVIEMWERLAYYTLRPVAPIYIMQATEPGGLHLTAEHKGLIYALWAVFQSGLPTVTGGYADRYGYKKTIAFAVTLNMIGYLIMAFQHNYAGFFAGVLVLATGTAFFKPGLQGTLAHMLTKQNSSLGWGIFYWVVNFGAFFGHLISPLLLGAPHSAEGWRNLFLACAGFTALNLLLLFPFPSIASGASLTESPWAVFKKTIVNVFEPRLLVWLLIMSGFWMMMYQLWDLQPNFIEDWIDSSAVAAVTPVESWVEYGPEGRPRVAQQILISLNAFLILGLIIPISWLVRRMRTLSTMLLGMFGATGGVLLAGLTQNGWFLLAGIVLFSLGEMLTGPKKNEYLGLIAPPGKKGLYLGYVNIPVGIGVGIGSWLAGMVYGNYGEKATLALKELAGRPQIVARAATTIDWSDGLDKLPALLNLPREQAVAAAVEELGVDRAAAEAALRNAYRYDSGQITNLALQYLATETDLKTTAMERLPPVAEPDAATRRTAGLASRVIELPRALGTSRAAAFELLRFHLNKDKSPESATPDDAIVAMLWERYGTDPDVLANLALEYLAQGTARLERAVAATTFPEGAADIQSKLGITRTKAFAALSRAMGATETELAQRLDQESLRQLPAMDRAYAALIAYDHQRFLAVARKNWPADVPLLREMIESDPAALAVVREALPGDPIDWTALAGKLNVIQDALEKKNWANSPAHAARLLGLGAFETRATLAGEMNGAAIAATTLLWDKYYPQYFTWFPFAAVGVISAIALGIFGQMAKRWADMNA